MIKQFWIVLKNLCHYNILVCRARSFTSNPFIIKLLEICVIPCSVIKMFGYFCWRDIKGRKGLAFVLIAKNEAPYIEEWINFHRKQGVSHFIIYDNDSTDNFHEVLKPYIDSGVVSYHKIPGKLRQNDSYNMAVHDYGHKFKYMGFIDCDEFVFLRNTTERGGGLSAFLDRFMSEHPNAGGLAVNWCIFGSNGHITKPEGGVLENYTMRSEDDFTTNLHIKTICDPQKVFCYVSCHFPIYFRGFFNLDENGNIVQGAFTSRVSFEKIRINHYFTKSREEYIAKKNRGKADCADIRPMSDFDRHDQNIIHDTEILSYA